MERPILFGAPMVRAILDGRKSQTRRIAPIVDLNIKSHDGGLVSWGIKFSRAVKGVLGRYSGGRFSVEQTRQIIASQFNPYGHPGDRLYVKETFFAWGHWEQRRDAWHFSDMTIDSGKEYRYAATHVGDNGPRQRGSVTPQWWKRPAIFMPMAASRILLEITGVRVERLNDISEADAISEGLYQDRAGRWTTWSATEQSREHLNPIEAYRELWEQINGNKSWSANPWVWVVEFRMLRSAGSS